MSNADEPTGVLLQPVRDYKPFTAEPRATGWHVFERGEPVISVARGGLRSSAKALAILVAELLNREYSTQPFRVEPVRYLWHSGSGDGRVCHEGEAWILTGPGLDDRQIGFGDDGRLKLQKAADALNDDQGKKDDVT